MGAWGEESCSNDNCWDYLNMENIHEPKQVESDSCLAEMRRLFDNRTAKDIKYGIEGDYVSQGYIGCVVWLLRHGRRISFIHLHNGIEIAKKMLSDHEYINVWSSSGARKIHIRREIGQMEAALGNSGMGEPEYIPGLLEKMGV